ncbi:hypothetical protein MM1218R_01549 [Mycobacterium marinum]|nr:hypothetical protein MM1218R_01549 [Mycobacterium marinum]RFZ11451.1 hypothetical protein DE4381_01039 [Mycobacterium marinum]RFZ47814.1 hypothetical protein MSS4_03184 [Mycobacterium marinum]
MTSLVVVGPRVTFSGPTHDKFSFKYPKINPLVGEMYRVGSESGLEVWFPRDTGAREGHERWPEQAADRRYNATAVFAVFVGDSQAIPLMQDSPALRGSPCSSAPSITDS